MKAPQTEDKVSRKRVGLFFLAAPQPRMISAHGRGRSEASCNAGSNLEGRAQKSFYLNDLNPLNP